MINKHPSTILPIRSKLDMLDDMVQIIHYLHIGDRKAADELIKDMKIRAMFLDAEIQNRVLIFTDQIHFQYNTDPWHRVTPDIQHAADHLIEQLGFRPPT